MSHRHWIGVDVGTGSVRATVADDAVLVVKRAIDRSKTSDSIGGIGFDATCSLVVLDVNSQPVGVSPQAPDAADRNIILWRDHRAVKEARELTAIGLKVAPELINGVGGAISPEMELPKLLWLRKNMPSSWSRIAHAMDLCDFLTFRATGQRSFSLCAAVCKWQYDGERSQWNHRFLEAAGLADLRSRIDARVCSVGEPVTGTKLSKEAAEAFGISSSSGDVIVAAGMVDAHAGALGLLGASYVENPSRSVPLSLDQVEQRAALICGTSTCFMAVRKQPVHVSGVWGPLRGAVLPSVYLLEGGESATGALLEHVVKSHPVFAASLSSKSLGDIYALLNKHVAELTIARKVEFPALLTRDLHVLPFHAGNRSPYADPLLRGSVIGLTLERGIEDLAMQYYATLQSLAHGVRLLLEHLATYNAKPNQLLVTGGLAVNSLWLQELADISQCEVYLPVAKDAVLLGSAVCAATAYEFCNGKISSEDAPSAQLVLRVCARMTALGKRVQPQGGKVKRYHDLKHQIFRSMYDHQMLYRKAMAEFGSSAE